MTETMCKAITASGEQCKLKAGTSGFCHIHDPEKAANREAARKASLEENQTNWLKGKNLREVIEIVTSTCKAKGWASYAKNIDQENWRYATIFVSRSAYLQEVIGLVELTVDDGVRVSINKTSFHGTGLTELHKAIMNELGKLPWLESSKKSTPDKSKEALDQLKKLIGSFHVVARQLRRRYGSRETLVIRDEYDVQDLLHALLKTSFFDVRPEEYSPSYAGSSSRIDFLLKKEQIVIEVKMAGNTLKDKQIGEQLIIDIKRYQMHPDCKTLVCFVYDPESNIRNPVGLETDLSGTQENIDVHVFVIPK